MLFNKIQVFKILNRLLTNLFKLLNGQKSSLIRAFALQFEIKIKKHFNRFKDIVIIYIYEYLILSLCLVCVQWSGSCSSTLWEAASIQSSQIQLLPLRFSAIRQTRTTRGNRKNYFCRICWTKKRQVKRSLLHIGFAIFEWKYIACQFWLII